MAVAIMIDILGYALRPRPDGGRQTAGPRDRDDWVRLRASCRVADYVESAGAADEGRVVVHDAGEPGPGCLVTT